ncbi:5-deoxy-glucuronate isomerase [Enterococcus sp. CWB-B31]|uniref:5-deoxy-glucuronate isomerase n=1 Tax=Enterococcus sp. CWB-B31 TaxID=2885159 RepID=UPI001E474A0F|nr:5-deoxy-glucuronate isomerase [Enterococcus sp. CWB-B31]MCB5955360.1 5-deoxy-glucuronate isomerase [Enterococcus sp. CWB-B31]
MNSYLQRKPKNKKISDGVILQHEITVENSPFAYVGFKKLDMDKGAEFEEDTMDKEACVLILTGKVTVIEGDNVFAHIGKRNCVFDKNPTDSVYISNDHTYKIIAETPAAIAIGYAPSSKQLPTKLIKAEENSVVERGKYLNKRLVNTMLDDESSIADSLLMTEVYTAAGNTSSYPPHRHSFNNYPEETYLEESYYHEINPQQGFVLQRVYNDDRTIDTAFGAENGDVILCPEGYHPVAVPDGYESYYLNVMAGPVKSWSFYKDPAHSWIDERE